MLNIGLIKNMEMGFQYQLIINPFKSRSIRPLYLPFSNCLTL